MSLSFLERNKFFQMALLCISFSLTAGLTICLLIPAWRSSWLSCQMSSTSSLESPLLCLSPLFHCCRPSASVASSQISLFSGFLFQRCPCLNPYEYVPFALQGRRGISVVPGRQTTSARTQYCLGSCSSPIGDVMQPSVYGVPASPLHPPLLLDLPPNPWP
jgi:hypothetical protein